MSTLELGQRCCVLCSHMFGSSIGGNCLPPTTPFLPSHKGTHITSFCLPVCLSLCLPFKSIPLLNSPHPFLSPSMCLHLHLLARFFPISLLLKSETAQNPMRFFFGQPRGNGSERKAQVRLQPLIKNLHCPAWRDVRNDFGFDLSKSLCLTCTDLYEDTLCIHFRQNKTSYDWKYKPQRRYAREDK